MFRTLIYHSFVLLYIILLQGLMSSVQLFQEFLLYCIRTLLLSNIMKLILFLVSDMAIIYDVVIYISINNIILHFTEWGELRTFILYWLLYTMDLLFHIDHLQGTNGSTEIIYIQFEIQDFCLLCSRKVPGTSTGIQSWSFEGM